MKSFTFDVRFSRRIPDPVFGDKGLTRYLFVVPVRNLPMGLPTDANARSQNVRTRVARQIKESLLNNECVPNTFHLKNNGITIIAERVQKKSRQKDRYDVFVGEGQGIIDGGHTYKIITDTHDDEKLPECQYVNVEVLTCVEKDWIPDIAGGRNTTVQVAPMSLDNLKGRFQWIKDELQDQEYGSKIAWSENENCEFDARDIVALLTLFNIKLFPNDGDQFPVQSYSQKASTLTRFEDNPNSFEKMKGILKDILVLHDTIRCNYYYIWNQQSSGTKAGGLSISQKKKKGKWQFIFTGEEAEYRMVNAALYPILGAFRWFVIKEPDTDQLVWRDGFESVLRIWEECSLSLLSSTHEMSRELGYRPNSLGKSTALWRTLHQLIAVHDLKSKSS